MDYDNDGLLDLFVCNYVTWSKETDLSQMFTLDGESRAYGPPKAFAGSFSYLYHNEGDGKFKDVSATAGIQIRNDDTDVPLGKAMGVAPVDVNDDGWIDIVVANDTVRNFLFQNNQDGTFSEIGQLVGNRVRPQQRQRAGCHGHRCGRLSRGWNDRDRDR